MKRFFEFPNPVNEYAARFVAFFVLFFSTVILITDNLWAISLLFIGFLLRLLFGPRLSPFALITLKLIIPLLKNPNKSVPGPPKRFAQFIGTIMTLIASIIYFFTSYHLIVISMLGILILFTFLESILSFCFGCYVFNFFIRIGLIPENICEACIIEKL